MNSKRQLLDFLEACKKEGISSVNDKFDQQKATKIADKLGLDLSNGIESVFKDANNIATKKTNSKIDIEQVREEDYFLLSELSEYSDLYGNDKPIKMLQNEYDKTVKELKIVYEQVKNSEETEMGMQLLFMQHGLNGLEKEKSWAIAGGIANGIAGPGAGIATAIEVQRQNAEIRARNAQRKSEILQTSMMFENLRNSRKITSHSIQSNINELGKKLKDDIEKYELKVIDDCSDEEAFQFVSVDELSSKIDEAGSITVTAKLSLKEQCKVFGKKCGYVDGTLTAKIFQNKQFVGVADLVLPINGLKKPVTIDGICVCNTQSKDKCVVEIIPKNLWIMEA